MNARPAMVDSGAAWVVASAALAILTIAYGAPLLCAVALKPIAADLHTARSGPSAAGSFTLPWVPRSAEFWPVGCPDGSRFGGSSCSVL